MNRPRLITYLVVALLMLPGLGVAGAAFIYSNPTTEQLVEGHTVFATLQTAHGSDLTEDRFTAAVAVLIREYHRDTVASRFPGVLWFNDQYLTLPTSPNAASSTLIRYPCTGAVLAVNQGDPAPPTNAAAYTSTAYVESYQINDPNDHVWIIDKWLFNGTFVWSVAMRGMDNTYSVYDTGSGNCGPYTDSAPKKTPGAHGMGYPCTSCAAIKYNALLYFFLEDLTTNPGGQKNHTEGSTDRANDASGCQRDLNGIFPDKWPCPADDDDREGNSHPYNRELSTERNVGRGEHGGSADCDAAPGDDQYCHAIRNIEIYYGVASLVTRNIVELDVQGRSAPYHCHEESPAGDSCPW